MDGKSTNAGAQDAGVLAAGAAGWGCSLLPLSDASALADEWRTLEQIAEPSFFLSWDWIGCWLTSLPPDRRPLVLRVRDGDSTIGLALLCRSDERWLGLLPRRTLRLHESGDTALDSLTIEYNGVLAPRTLRDAVLRHAVEWLLYEQPYDRVVLSGVPDGGLARVDVRRIAIGVRDAKPTYTVRLDTRANRSSEDGLMANLSSNTRGQLRRAIRQYEKLGPLRLVSAESIDEALRMFDALAFLHQRYWQQRGRPGAFAEATITTFHRRLIANCFAGRRVQLLEVFAGSSPIGYLYNFRHGPCVVSYQSGFDYDLVPRAKPGWVCHYLAMDMNGRDGASLYDLLAGHSQFKASFGEPTTTLVWLVAERQDLLTSFEKALRGLKHLLTRQRTP